MTRTVQQRSEEAGKRAVETGVVKSRRLRDRLETDEELRRRLVIGGVSALVAAAVGGLSWLIWKKRDALCEFGRKAKKSAKETLDKATGAVTGSSTAPKPKPM